ncbi:MAG: hypothetical protein QOJ40_933 [Verrucomicrobiota bacterium]
MKTSIRSINRPLFAGLALTALFLCSPAKAEIRLTANATADATVNPPRFSPGIADVVRMVDAKIEADVIIAYINSSRIPYNPAVNEIIALKERGVSPVILTAMLQHGGEVRAQMAQASTSAPAPASNPYSTATTPYPATPAYDYGVQPAYSYDPYAYSYPAYGYSYYPYYGYDWGWPFIGAAFDLGWCGRGPFHHGFGGRDFGFRGHSGPFGLPGFSGRAGFSIGHGGFSGRSASFGGNFGGFSRSGFAGRSSSFGGHSGGGFGGGGGRSGGGHSGHGR